jgi:hypothetical protein
MDFKNLDNLITFMINLPFDTFFAALTTEIQEVGIIL